MQSRGPAEAIRAENCRGEKKEAGLFLPKGIQVLSFLILENKNVISENFRRENQRNRNSVRWLISPRNVGEATPVKSYQHGCLNDPAKKTPIDVLMWPGESSGGLIPRQRTSGNWGLQKAGEVVSREEHTKWSSNNKWFTLKIYKFK